MTRICPRGSVYLAAFERTLTTICVSRVTSPLIISPVAWDLDVELMLSFLQQRTGRFHGRRHDVRDLDQLPAKIDLPSGNARDVQQVVHEADQMPNLPIDDRALLRGAAVAAKRHQLKGGENRRQRVPQLVSQHGEELVLRPVGRFGGRAQMIHLVARRDLVGHVEGDDENALDRSVDAAKRRVDEIEVHRIERAVAAPVERAGLSFPT